MQKYLTLILAVILLAGAGCSFWLNSTPQNNAAGLANLQPEAQNNIAPIAAGAPPNWILYVNSTGGYQFKYPADLFIATPATSAAIILTSPYYVEENYAGGPDAGFKQQYKISFDVVSGTIAESLMPLKNANPSYAEQIDAVMRGEDVDLTGFYNFKPVEIAGQLGYSYVEGIEGDNTLTMRLQKTMSTMLEIKLTYYTDFRSNSVKPSPFSEQEELNNFNQIINTIQFTQL